MKKLAVAFYITVFALLLATTMQGQIIANNGAGLGLYSAYGIPLNTNLVAGLSEPQGIAISGTNIFVANYSGGTIGEYTLSGEVVSANLITGLITPEGIAISGTNIFVAYDGRIGVYTILGSTVTNNLIPRGLSIPIGLAISGTNLFVANNGNGTIGEYTTSGAAVNTNLISGLGPPSGIAISGTNLYVTFFSSSKVVQCSTSGAILKNPLLKVPGANGIVVSGDLLFVLGNDVVGEYTTSGGTNNAALFSVAYDNSAIPFGVAVFPASVSTVPTVLAMNASATNIALSWPTNASDYQIQTSPLLNPANWIVVTNQPVLTNGNFSTTLNQTNQAQFFRLQSIND
jgi:hypothetical protein